MNDNIFNWLNLIISIISLCFTIWISIIAYNFSLREKREKYRKELEDYYNLMQQYIYILKAYYFELYTSFDLYLEHKEYYGNYENFIKELMNIFKKYNLDLENINNEVFHLKNANSLYLFFKKYPKYLEYYSGCFKNYILFRSIVNYISDYGTKHKIDDKYFSSESKEIKKYEKEIEDLQKEYINIFFKINNTDKNYFDISVFDDTLTEFIKGIK